ncbi:hypothetical protein [Wolbachia endosymbiont of Litomosoides brasiliensis]|nr:hypothetical protein [Wolbachia endosymbiont of Litomosoides brasiliensis]
MPISIGYFLSNWKSILSLKISKLDNEELEIWPSLARTSELTKFLAC